MIGLYFVTLAVLIIYTILIIIIAYKRGFGEGVKSIRGVYLRSLAEIKNNYNGVSERIKEMQDADNTITESVPNTEV